MAKKYLNLAITDSVCREEKKYYGHAAKIADAPERDPLTAAEVEFIAARDSFYLGTISESGWPYIQHRGGPTGFLRVLNPTTLAFADYLGNRQLLTTGNVAANDHVSLFLMDYRNRERLKILGYARIEDARAQPVLTTQVSPPGMQANVERVVVIDVVSFDWNCPKYITTRYSVAEVEELAESLRGRIAELEEQLRAVQT
ncbi:MAG TPA: pyridoxamine 5'-phosphate oxidase family protein [Nitrospiraceae bacterium]|nr:pyridoxamine 5'-phosphate oxidase family protein [Nitrospiraceae bacterium]